MFSPKPLYLKSQAPQVQTRNCNPQTLINKPQNLKPYIPSNKPNPHTPSFKPPHPKLSTQTPDPKRQVSNQKSSTSNPKPQTPNPKPRTPNPEPQTPNPDPRTQKPEQGAQQTSLMVAVRSRPVLVEEQLRGRAKDLGFRIKDFGALGLWGVGLMRRIQDSGL
jgi:hypothetical protein